MKTIQDTLSDGHSQEKEDIAKLNMHEQMLADAMSTNNNDEENTEQGEEQINGFEVFMRNSKGNFSKLIGCGG